ncbi:hypothetical protein FACS1894164_01550 [Spirochaetia bacterium]|nr:hypothetical protein FACS1894164_01550 [Spirochaetia bacterium]
MKKFFIVALTVVFFGVLMPEPVSAANKVVIKLASLIPENTPWGVALKRMASEWSRATNGEVELQIYHNGVVGGEEDCLRKLKSNQIQGAVFTSMGLSLITPEIMTLSVPFLLKDDTELDFVLDAIGADLEVRIIKQGFFPVAWAKSGWVQFFSKSPVWSPADLRKLKVATAPESPKLTDTFKSMGFQLVPANQNDMMIFLSSNKIEALYSSPMAMAASQLFAMAKNMASLNIAPFMGAVIFNQRAWRAIPDQYKPRLLEIADSVEKEISLSVAQLEADAVRTMVSYGLIVNQVSPAQEQQWIDEVNRAMPSLLGSVFDRDLYTKITAILQSYRK